MNSKTRVMGALSGGGFDRLPMWYGAEPGLTEKIQRVLGAASEEEMMTKLEVDFRTVRPRYVGPPLKHYDNGNFDTMWGITRGGGFWGTALTAPLEGIEDLSEIKEFVFPNPDWFDVSFNEEDRKLSEKYAIIGGEWAPFWHEAHELVTIEKMLLDFHLNPAFASALLERCLEFHQEINERAFRESARYIDIYWFANDFGTSNGLIMSPDMWRRFIKPLQAKLAEQGRKYGLRIAMHSCGDITQIIPDLIEIGIEILNPIQVSCPAMDPVFLKREYGKDLIFFGAIDYNELLSFGTPEQVRNEVRRTIDVLGHDGRYIVAPSHDLLMAEVPTENILALYTEAKEYSRKYAR